MIERRTLEADAVVGERFHQRRHGHALGWVGTPAAQGERRVVAAGGIEVDDLLETRLAAGVEVGTGQLDVTERWHLERAPKSAPDAGGELGQFDARIEESRIRAEALEAARAKNTAIRRERELGIHVARRARATLEHFEASQLQTRESPRIAVEIAIVGRVVGHERGLVRLNGKAEEEREVVLVLIEGRSARFANQTAKRRTSMVHESCEAPIFRAERGANQR